MADTTNLSQFLSDVADAIRTKKETTEQIPAADFDQEILSIETGIDTSDADATADDIVSGKTAYVKGEKINGILPESQSGASWNIPNPTIEDSELVENSYDISMKADVDFVVRTNSNIITQLPYQNITEKAGLTPDKLVKGNTILGIEGTAETGTEINNQDKEITENGIYTADEGYTGLGTVIVSVPQEDLQEQLDNQDLIIQQLQEELVNKAYGGGQLSYSELFALATSIYDTGIADDSETANFTIDDEMICLQRGLKILRGVV